MEKKRKFSLNFSSKKNLKRVETTISSVLQVIKSDK
jgi:hypothetical protein